MKTLRQFLMTALVLLGVSLTHAQGGPVVLMGIDAEDGGVGGHGPITVYQNLARNILSNTFKPNASGILVIGGSGPFVTSFWNAVGTGLGVSVTYASGDSAIASATFSGFALLGIASDYLNTGGGMTPQESQALNARAADIATHVNSGGGLLGFSSCSLPNGYAYLGGLGNIACVGGGSESNITPTAEGVLTGVTDQLDICCWHDGYTSFPSGLKVLATYPSGLVAAVGGVQVVVPGFVLSQTDQSAEVGNSHAVTIEVTETVGGTTNPVVGVTVGFTVSGANTSTGTCVTDNSGRCSFSYQGLNAGSDTITANATVTGRANTASAAMIWTLPSKLNVGFDFKPAGCRNPYNINAESTDRSVVPTAITGAPNFDVAKIDPTSIRLEGVRPVRWAIQDVATHYVPVTGKTLPTHCTSLGADGIPDLMLQFNGQALANALGGSAVVPDGAVRVLKLTGRLNDGTLIEGEDVVVILNKRKGD